MERERREGENIARRYARHTESGERIDLLDPAYEADLSVRGGVFEHYKSTEQQPKYYRADRIIRHAQSQDVLVVYEALYAPEQGLHARPLAMFIEPVEHTGDTTARFRFIGMHE